MAFIRAAEELTRLLVAHDTMETPPAADSTFGANVAQLVGSIDREYVTVVLAGPEQARAAVGALSSAWQVSIVDLEWGRNDMLWLALERFAAAQPAAGSA